MTLNVGLIAAGGITRVHLRGYSRIPELARVVAVADNDLEAARRRVGETPGIDIYQDYQAILDRSDVDAVDICLPHHLHAAAVVAAARAGKHVLCEKPLCLDLDEAQQIAEAVTDSGVTMMCAHNQLFMPAVARAKELLADGAIGQVFELRTTDSFYGSQDPTSMGWRAERSKSGGGELIDTGYHPTYLMLHLAGSRPVEVAAMTSQHRLTFSDGEDSAQVLVRFADGKVGHIVTSWAYEPATCTERFSAVGDQGSLWSDGTLLERKIRGGDSIVSRLPTRDTFEAEVKDFAECIRDGRRPLHTHIEGTEVLRVILGAYRSAAERRIVALDEL
ncbi:MAG TPA: Gfo/Idh/MocA family oxidoreductase [Acidimicrobiales bacterium]|nr:Gfo/Idh/MocA family oxidoreductase [Acidimicrobiales bacterium]